MLSTRSTETALECSLVMKLLQRGSMLSNMHRAELHNFAHVLVLGLL